MHVYLATRGPHKGYIGRGREHVLVYGRTRVSVRKGTLDAGVFERFRGSPRQHFALKMADAAIEEARPQASCVSVCALGLRVAMYFMILVASLFVIGGMGTAVKSFVGNECPLSYDYTYGANKVGSKNPCNFVMFTGVVSAVISFIIFAITVVNYCKRSVRFVTFRIELCMYRYRRERM